MTPYHYTRVESFDDHDVLVVGGSDHPAGQHPSEYYNAYAQLEQYARERWTQAGEVLYRWTGQVSIAMSGGDVFPRPVKESAACSLDTEGISSKGDTLNLRVYKLKNGRSALKNGRDALGWKEG